MSKSNLIEIDNFAFGYCDNVIYIQFPMSIQKIGWNPFVNIHYSEGKYFNNEYILLDNQGVIVDKTNQKLISYVGKDKTIDLSIGVLNKPIKTIGAFSFVNAAFIKTILHNNVTIDSIERYSGLSKQLIESLTHKQ